MTKDRRSLKSHTIRFPFDLYFCLQELADEERRSFNSQVIAVLETGVKALQSCKDKDGQDEKQNEG